jgi:transglutaminase-like putative cysteine protease
MLQLYKILTAVLAFTGCIGLVISGEINLLMSVSGAALIPGYYRFLIGRPPAPQWVIGGCSVLALVVLFLDYLLITGDFFISVAHLTITFQAIKSFDLKEPWDHLQVYFMSLLQLIIASELMYSITFGFFFILFLVVFVTAIIFSHFIKEKEGKKIQIDLKKPLLYISLLTLMITVIFFVTIPRISGGIWTKGHRKTIKSVGFSEKVNLGSFGAFKLDPTVIMRIELDQMVPGPYYWRGMTLDSFDGTSWRSTLMRTRRLVRKIEGGFLVQPSTKETVTQKIMLEPLDSRVIFGLESIISVKGDFFRLEKDPASSLFMWRRGTKRIQYTVKSDITTSYKITSENVMFWERYKQIPDSLKGQIKTLTDRILESEGRGSLTDLQKARSIERYLKSNYRYSLNINAPRGTNPILYFLFQSKTGFCEHYATAMTLMLRSAGIPARVVTGFLGGELNTYGGYIIVRQSNAHSWVEALIDGSWKRFDPTPSVSMNPPSTFTLYVDMLRLMWNRYVIAFSSADQKEIIKAVSMPFVMPHVPDLRLSGLYIILMGVLLISTIVATIFIVKHIRFKRYGFVTAQYLKLLMGLKQRGIMIKPTSTSSEIRKEAAHLEMNQEILEAIKLYEEYRFGNREVEKEGRARYQLLIREIKRQLKR